MRAGALVLLGIVIAAHAAATPPVQGGIMIGPDSSLVLYWVHPAINHYEQGYDDNSENMCLVGGGDPGAYAIAVDFSVPFAACLESIRIRMFLTDLYIDQPGDQYSLFRSAVYAAASDGSPNRARFTEDGQLCGGEPCLDDWFEQPLYLPFMAAGRHWMAFHWQDETPMAPQLKGRVRRLEDPTVLWGYDDGGGLTWDSLYYVPVFRQRLLGFAPLDTAVAVGWRHRLTTESPPDSFLISGFLADTVAADFVYANTDTLIFRLPAIDYDSICIRSCYGDLVDDSALTVSPEKSKAPPILADIVFPDSKSNPSVALHVVNLAAEPISLRLGYDHNSIAFDTDTVLLTGHEARMISGTIMTPIDDTTDVIVMLVDEDARYYPFVVMTTYPQDGQTDAADDGREGIPGIDQFVRIYPNPCFKTVHIADDNFRAVRRIDVYNVIGQRIADIAPPFRARMVWNGCDREGRAMPAGIYFVRISYADAVKTKAVLLMR